MIARKIFFILLWCCTTFSVAARDSLAVMGEAPEKGVYDPLDWLEPERKLELERNFQEARSNSGVRIFVVVLPQRPSDGAPGFAKRVGRKWGGTETWGVILHVVGDEESPWCVAGKGGNLRWAKVEEIDRAVEEAVSRVSREPDQDARVMVGARELADELSFLEAVSSRRADILGEKANREESSDQGQGEEQGLFLRRVMMVTALVLVILLVVMVVMKTKTEDRDSGYLFPETAPRRRFSGPWSGGGNVLVRFSEEKSRRR